MGRSRKPRHAIWDDVIWPVLVGALVATALWDVGDGFGVAFAIGFFAAVDLAITPVAVDVGSAFGKDWRRAAFVVAPTCALAVEVVIGSAAAFGVWVLPILATAILSAPPVRTSVLGRLHRAAEISRIRREFDAIVAGQFVTSPPSDDT